MDKKRESKLILGLIAGITVALYIGLQIAAEHRLLALWNEAERLGIARTDAEWEAQNAPARQRWAQQESMWQPLLASYDGIENQQLVSPTITPFFRATADASRAFLLRNEPLGSPATRPEAGRSVDLANHPPPSLQIKDEAPVMVRESIYGQLRRWGTNESEAGAMARATARQAMIGMVESADPEALFLAQEMKAVYLQTSVLRLSARPELASEIEAEVQALPEIWPARLRAEAGLRIRDAMRMDMARFEAWRGTHSDPVDFFHPDDPSRMTELPTDPDHRRQVRRVLERWVPLVRNGARPRTVDEALSRALWRRGYFPARYDLTDWQIPTRPRKFSIDLVPFANRDEDRFADLVKMAARAVVQRERTGRWPTSAARLGMHARDPLDPAFNRRLRPETGWLLLRSTRGAPLPKSDFERRESERAGELMIKIRTP